MTALTVHFFGSLAERFGTNRVLDVPAAGLSVAEVRARLTEATGDPGLNADGIRAAVGDGFVGEDHRVMPGDQVDFLAPLSGG